MKDCVGLETAKKLQDAGIYFRNSFRMYCVGCSENKIILRSEIKKYNKLKLRNMICNAPTTNEMLEWLPSDFDGFPLTIRKNNKLWEVGYINRFNTGECIFDLFTHKTPQEALAKLCLWVRKEGHK